MVYKQQAQPKRIIDSIDTNKIKDLIDFTNNRQEIESISKHLRINTALQENVTVGLTAVQIYKSKNTNRKALMI